MPTEVIPPAEQPVIPSTEGTPALPRSDAPPAQVSTEDLAEQAREKMAKTEGFWNRVNPPKEVPKEGAKDKQQESEPPAPEKKPEKKEKKPKTEAPPETPAEPEEKPRRRKKEIDPIELAEATGRAIASEMAKERPAPTPKEPEAEPELPEEFKPDVAVFEEMARLDPKRYGDVKKELARYAKAEDEYTAKWETDHPGEEFDPESDEHDDFYKRIKPKYDQRDFEAAKESLIEQRAAARAEERLRQQFEQREQQRERASQIKPEIERQMVGLMGEMLKEADPANAELAKDWASIQTLDEKNPLLADVLVQVHNETKPVLEAAVRLFRGIDKVDQNNPAHQRLFTMIAEAEQQVSRMPLKDRYDEEGRLFATQDEFAKMSQQERQRHWYVGEQEMAAVIRGRSIQQTKSIYQHEKQRHERYAKGQPAIASTQQPAQPRPSEAAQAKPDTSSPSVGGRATLPSDGTPAQNKPSSGKDWFWNRYIG